MLAPGVDAIMLQDINRWLYLGESTPRWILSKLQDNVLAQAGSG